MASYKLVYFDFRARAEPVRWIFAYAGQEFEDFRFKPEDWPNYKPGTPFGQVPVLEVDGTPLCQSATICRYLANQFGLVSKDPWEKALADQYVDCVEDILKAFQKYFFGPKDQKAEAKQTFVNGTLANILSKFDTIAGENRSGFLVGNEVTWADIVMSAYMENLENMTKGDLSRDIDRYPNVRRLINKVQKLPKIAAWLAARPQQDM